MSSRYYLDRDGDSHWYIIPAEKRQEWEAFCNLDPDSEASWDTPKWAQALGGSPNNIEFERWTDTRYEHLIP